MFPPETPQYAASFVRRGVLVDVVQMNDGTRVYYPVVADWIDQEVKASRRRRGKPPLRSRRPTPTP